MLHFLQNFIYYVTYEVIGPRGSGMQSAIDNAQNMDEVIAVHEDFLDSCLKECLLASQDLLRILTKIMTTCILFADQMKRFATASQLMQQNQGSQNTKSTTESQFVIRTKRRIQAEYIRSETSHESYRRMISKFAEHFDTQLGEFLENLWADSNRHHPQLSNLCARLDYNGYYSDLISEQV
jgi:gamma-tubulin complex component 2